MHMVLERTENRRYAESWPRDLGECLTGLPLQFPRSSIFLKNVTRPCSTRVLKAGRNGLGRILSYGQSSATHAFAEQICPASILILHTCYFAF